MTPPYPLVVGNWKMNGNRAALEQIEGLAMMLRTVPPRCSVAICPPVTLISAAAELVKLADLWIGAQDCHEGESGAYTGEVSARMLLEAGAQVVLVGHSERRIILGETSERVRLKADAALKAGLVPIVCVGETRAEREAGRAEVVVCNQMRASMHDSAAGSEIAVAYEPVWAIGTGLTPTSADIAQMHSRLRQDLIDRFGETGAAIRILYGGSLKPANAKEILSIPDVNGGLVGGASLVASDFFEIISAA